jgi:signal peptidase I
MTGAQAAQSRLARIGLIALFVAGGAAVLAVLVLRAFFFQSYSIASASFSPTLNLGDIVVASDRAYAQVAPSRGDVVILRVPASGEQWVKRVVGLPGDHVQMVGGVLCIDGRAVKRQRIADFMGLDGAPDAVVQYRETLPGGRAYNTLDIGPSEFDNTPVFVVPAGSYFVLGDNRDNSLDSRSSLGYLKREDILGRVIERVYSKAAGVALSAVE